MAWLYTDTTNHVVYGLLSETFEWIEYVENRDKKSTSDLHFLINEMFNRHTLSIEKMKGHLFAAGPGSYTGMRVSEGMAQVFEWQNICVYSFYHYEIPQILNSKSGIWFSEAFKGEMFVYDLSSGIYELLSLSDFQTKISSKNKIDLFTHFNNSNSMLFIQDFNRVQFTGETIKNIPQKVFFQVVSLKRRVSPLYYRSEDREFLPSKK